MAEAELRALIAAQIDRFCEPPDAAIRAVVEELQRRHRNRVAAVLIYGSWLRGRRDTPLDAYVLLDRYAAMPSRWQGALCWLLPPNVHHLAARDLEGQIRVQYALMTLGRFDSAVRTGFHSYFWARFAQPCLMAYTRDAATRQHVIEVAASAALKFVRRVVPLLPPRFDAELLMATGFEACYRCELRAEPPAAARALFGWNAEHYRQLVSLLANDGLGYRLGQDAYINETSSSGRALSALAWRVRRVQGKALSVLRLLKASLTFNDGLEYLLWKIERHSGLRVEPSPAQRRFPLLFGWPLLWRLYRRGAFR